MRQQTWFAVIVCATAVIPGFLVGALFKGFMYVFGGWAENSDFLYLHTLFGLDAPGALYNFIFAGAVPNGVQAFVAGFVAVWLMERIAKGANYVLSATITGALYTGFFICLLIVALTVSGFTTEMLLAVCQCMGLWAGLWSAAASLPAPQRATV